MTARPIRSVISGAIRHADSYAHLLAAHNDFTLLGIYEHPDASDTARTRARECANEAGLNLLDRLPYEPCLVVICTEPTRHAAAARDALQNGHHVLIDKPVATSTQDVQELTDLAATSPGICTGVTRALGSPTTRTRASIDDGHIGFIRSIDIEFLAHGAHFATSVERPELVCDPNLSGGGEVMNFLGYAIDTIRFLTGLNPSEVMAFSTTAFSKVHQDYGVEDCAVISFLLDRGVTATVTVGRIPAAPSQAPNASTWRIVGSHGHLTVNENTPSLDLYTTDGHATIRRIGSGVEDQAIQALLSDLAIAVRAGNDPSYTITDAAVTIATIDAAYQSILTGQPTPIALPEIKTPSRLT